MVLQKDIMKKLLIVEAPAKIKTIAKFLDNTFEIKATRGHVKDLPERTIGVSFDDNGHVLLEYDIIEGKEKVLQEIVRAARDAHEVYLAPDPDREGEIIAWHVEQELLTRLKKKNGITISRIFFNEISKTAVVGALQNPTKINTNRVAAQQARRVLDRWVGYCVSPILWRKVAPGLSAGRV